MHYRLARKNYRFLLNIRLTNPINSLPDVVFHKPRDKMWLLTHRETPSKDRLLGLRLYLPISRNVSLMSMLALLWGETGAKQPWYISAIFTYIVRREAEGKTSSVRF